MLPPHNGTRKTPLFYLNQGWKAGRGLSTNLICLVLCCCSSLPPSLSLSSLSFSLPPSSLPHACPRSSPATVSLPPFFTPSLSTPFPPPYSYLSNIPHSSIVSLPPSLPPALLNTMILLHITSSSSRPLTHSLSSLPSLPRYKWRNHYLQVVLTMLTLGGRQAWVVSNLFTGRELILVPH